jgi:hypothetical protein
MVGSSMQNSKEGCKSDFSQITSAKDMLEHVERGSLTIEPLKNLIGIHPEFIQYAAENFRTTAKAIEDAGQNQRDSFRILGESIASDQEILLTLAQNAESDSTREKLAEHLIKVSKQNKKAIAALNKENNSFYKTILIGATIVVGGALVAVAAAKASSRKEDDSSIDISPDDYSSDTDKGSSSDKDDTYRY